MSEIGRDALLSWEGPQSLVLATGIVRSGSTWLFNAVRLVAGIHDNDNPTGFWVEEFDPGKVQNGSYVVVKAHLPDDLLAKRARLIFSSYRDLRDIAVSGRDFGVSPNLESQLTIASEARAYDEFWSPRADLIVRYEDIVQRPIEVLASIAETLRIDVTKHECAAIAERLSAMKSPAPGTVGVHDHQTLLHVGHRSDGRAGRWRNTLDPSAAKSITDAHHDWLEAHGYGL